MAGYDQLPTGVMLNSYPDSIGEKLSDTVSLLKRKEFKDVFSLFYILPTFFNSDLDRGFSVIDYDLNRELVSPEDLAELEKLGIKLKFDLVLNHLSVGSPQFQDMLRHGDASEYKDFFINWDEFWGGHKGAEGHCIPKKEHLQKLFMRKPGLPILKVRFPDGSERPYWNTFYQEINYRNLSVDDLKDIDPQRAKAICATVNEALAKKTPVGDIDLGENAAYREAVVAVLERGRTYLGQMDLNARSEKVWQFYDETLKKLRDHGAFLVRLDAFAYLHKEPGKTNFFNRPGTWEYLGRLREMAHAHGLILLPEIHAEYGQGLHREVAGEGFPIYDFFFPGLVIDALERGINRYLLKWVGEIQKNNMQTINMLGCHDGLPVLDLKGKTVDGVHREGIMSDDELDGTVEKILARGGRVKNLYGPDGKKISYYQVNATFYSALGENEKKLRLARAIQMFMPGIPQVWYLDLFAGKNDYHAADHAGTAGHKEINRTTLRPSAIEEGLKKDIVKDQLDLMRLRNCSKAFGGELTVEGKKEEEITIDWCHPPARASLKANLRSLSFEITHTDGVGGEQRMSY